jgi:microcystin-dependent protein
MADQYVGEIRIFGCNFAPTGWAQCNGQLMPISQNTALFSLLGTTYGGDGKSTFALPNVEASATMTWGQGAGLTERYLGEQSGEPNVNLIITEIPAHNHVLNAVVTSTLPDPTNNTWGNPGNRRPAPFFYAPALTAPKLMNPMALNVAGSSIPHNNLQPYQVLNYCIALQGIFPPRG